MLRGSSATITNIYKWRSFVLTKAIQHQNIADAEDVVFKFKIEKKVGDNLYEPISGNYWIITDNTGLIELGESGYVAEDGTFSCRLAGRYVRIDDLEADETYRITEVSVTRDGKEVFNTLYEPLITSDEWKMPLHAFVSDGAYFNEWRMRPLYVSKTVTYDESSVSASQKANAAVFEMKVEVDLDKDNDGKPDGELVPLANFPYQVLKNGKVINDSGMTDSEGKFKIKNNEVVYFKDAGLIGAQFQVTETDSGTEFHQTYPKDGPVVGKLARDGTEDSPATIVNGMDSAIMLTKQYEISDANAQAYYDAMKSLPTGQNPLEVTISIRAFTKDGKTYRWPAHNTKVGIIAEGEDIPGQEATWYAGQSFNILPGQTIVLKSGLADDNVTSFNVSESASDRQWMQVWTKTKGDDYLIECTQTYPANGKAVTGQNGALKSITLVNTLTSYKPTGSAIMKDMVPGADPIPTYSRLVFALEKKVGEEWIPAEGIQYYVGHYTHGETESDWRDFEEGKTLYTGAEGLIEVSKADYTFPFVQFINDTVYVYGDPKMPTTDGTLRIRELLNESDSEWGTFAWNALLEAGEQFKPGWQATEGARTKPYDTIVNTNRSAKVRVGKKSSSESNTEFTFYLNQVIDVDWSLAPDGIDEKNYKTAIKGTLPGESVQYYIWKSAASDHESPTLVGGPHTIEEDGKFTIEAGQYAEFELPDKTVWTVYEDLTPGYYLDSMVTVEGKVYTAKLNENTTLISSAAGVVGDRITAVAKQEDWDLESELDKTQFTVTWYDTNGEHKELTPDQFTIEPQYAPSEEGPFVVVVTENNSGLTATVTVNAKVPYTVKYAVRIYGILTDDTNTPGTKAGLTFGPATGNDYREDDRGHSRCGNEDTCISNKTWEEIIEIANDNPNAFWECMKHGCVVSVPLKITGDLAGSKYVFKGDGASILRDSIAYDYRMWNATNSSAGGWPASRIRATLNGQDRYTQASVAGTNLLTTENCLLTAFPEDLQTNIVPKAVKSDVVSDKFDEGNMTVTYDKLWLLSGSEIYTKSGTNDGILRSYNGYSNEGPQYRRNQDMEVTTSENYSIMAGYLEAGGNSFWYTRSISSTNSSQLYVVAATGAPGNSAIINPMGIAPCFCVGKIKDPYTVKYAVRIYGILVDDTDQPGMKAGLTFGPATGEDFTHSQSGRNLCKQSGDKCISNLTWEEIVAQANKDPEVFEKCMEAGCVVSVPIVVPAPLASDVYYKTMEDGDGASSLSSSLKSDYRIWGRYTTGGWEASCIRASLNGATPQTQANTAGLDNLIEKNCLLTGFPAELRDGIVSKKVVSYIDGDKTATTTTLDKLWLFSYAEIYGDERSVEGSQYPFLKNQGVEFSTNTEKVLGYKEDGRATTWFLRTVLSASSVSAPSQWANGMYAEAESYMGYALSPGFCVGSRPGPDYYTVKYAVRIYGILRDDTDQPGLKAGLTFGPATSDKPYVDNSDGRNLCHRSDNCISNMTWSEIIKQANNDPTVFEECLEAGCVVSVKLNITGSLAGTSYYGQMDNGDGASVLYESIASNYRKWNNTGSSADGWPASRIRATLNGFQDKETNTTVAGTDNLTADTCLFAMFPEELQDAIVAKAVISDTAYDKLDAAYQKTTYDKLWLFSGGEIYKYDPKGEWNSGWLRVNDSEISEGPQYAGNTALNITSASYGNNIGYNESGTSGNWWLRSLRSGLNNFAGAIGDEGGPSHGTATSIASCLAPGFCIGLLPDPNPYTIKYAVRIYGIEVDEYKNSGGDKAALTFGPATSDKSYVNNRLGRNLCGNSTCISNMTWPEIIAQARTNPHVFEDCMNAGCVVSVPLNITGVLAGTSYKNKMDYGDGASVLYDSIASNYRNWNDDNWAVYGWPASRIRATLNGFQDGVTDTDIAGTDNLTADTCLFAMFPKELQESIVAKVVKSNAGQGYTPSKEAITYDNLWLFSGAEVFATGSGNNDIIREYEGSQYPGNNGTTTSSYSKNIGYTEAGSAHNWCLRTIEQEWGSEVYGVYKSGSICYLSVNGTNNGLAPGFCIR